LLPENPLRIGLRHHHRTRFAVGVRSDGDFDALTKGVEKAEQPVETVTFDAPAHQGRHLRLVESQQLGGLRLSELALGDQVPDASNQFCLGKCQVGIWQSEVSEHIPAAWLEPHWLLSVSLVHPALVA
jgi:hypothetical protein